jgi:cytochrome c553
MKFLKASLVAPVALMAVFSVGGASAQNAGATAPTAAAKIPQGEFDAKLAYCATCHGKQGQGYRAALPIPRLGGQQVEYIENQLVAFTEKRRENRFMYNVAHVLTPEMRDALANYWHNQNPPPAGTGAKELVPEGKKIFTDGIESAGVPACQSCHGADAKGNGVFPRLAGQLPEYIQRQLLNWATLRGLDPSKPDTSEMMKPITHGLNEAQIKAVAAYVSSLD